MKYLLIFLTLSLFSACHNGQKQEQKAATSISTLSQPVFNADSCYHYVANQTRFGPRTPNSPAHQACLEYLSAQLHGYADSVWLQPALLHGWDGKVLHSTNLIAHFQPHNPNRILLCSHWDSRPWADEDPVQEQRKQPIVGANDGASGVGVLLELARLLAKQAPAIGVDIVLFDSEDYGNSAYDNSFCLGSQYWASQKASGVKPRFGILLDMVGGKNARFYREGISAYYAPDILERCWQTAAQLGMGDLFIPEDGRTVIDDHYYINRIANIPCIDIIDATPDRGFPEEWHTHNDTMEAISSETLGRVGRLLTYIIYHWK